MLAIILAAAIATAPCANPSIVSTTLQSVTTSGGLDHYTIAITVQNQGDVRQPSDLLQSIDVFLHGERVDRIGLLPLRPGQFQKVTYSFDRSDDAGPDTTHIIFELNLGGKTGDDVDCHAGNETAATRV